MTITMKFEVTGPKAEKDKLFMPDNEIALADKLAEQVELVFQAVLGAKVDCERSPMKKGENWEDDPQSCIPDTYFVTEGE